MATNPNMVAIETVTVPSGGAASIEFTSIPQTYTDLVLKFSTRYDLDVNTFDLQINGVTTSQTARRVIGTGSSAVSSTYTEVQTNPSGATASTFGNGEIYIPNYTSSNNKSISIDAVSENNGTLAYATLEAWLWSNSAAITSLALVGRSSAKFVQYSSATLYGVTSAAVGAKATGGIITETDTHYIHTFLASGTFTPTQNLTADYLVVAGGGSGGAGIGGVGGAGGGGAGGYRYLTSQSLTNGTGYTITIGGGGAAHATGTVGSNGTNSSFSTTSATGGGKGGSSTSVVKTDGSSGGSGGGGQPVGGTDASGGTGNAGSYSPVEGYAGGTGTGSSPYGGGGGGGSSAVGANAGASGSGDGGAGTSNSITGSAINYAGGGGGGTYISGTAGIGGTGGGGNGSSSTSSAGSNGSINTGGGGGGGSSGAGAGQGGSNGGAGGSGVVIVRYAK
jgi:hypothetical protein